MIVVDDNSPDNTKEVVENLAKDFSEGVIIRLIVRRNERGLVSAILRGISEADSNIMCVLDADGSHPIDKIKHLVLPVLNKKADFTIGSRYISGGKISGWKFTRKILSRLGSFTTIGLTPVRDSMSGFFCFRKPSIMPSISNGFGGFKIALELLCNLKPKSVTEIPITFVDRKFGKSKLSFKILYSFVLQLLLLYSKKLL